MHNFSVLESDSSEIILDIASSHIQTTLQQIIKFLSSDSRVAVFEINGVTFNVKSDSDYRLIHRDYQRTFRGYIAGVVGPYPISEIDQETLDKERSLDTV
jgi:hypothetical protein